MRTRRRARRPADGPAPATVPACPSAPGDRAPDDADVGWGELPAGFGADDNDARLRADRPPHHIGD